MIKLTSSAISRLDFYYICTRIWRWTSCNCIVLNIMSCRCMFHTWHRISSTLPKHPKKKNGCWSSKSAWIFRNFCSGKTPKLSKYTNFSQISVADYRQPITAKHVDSRDFFTYWLLKYEMGKTAGFHSTFITSLPFWLGVLFLSLPVFAFLPSVLKYLKEIWFLIFEWQVIMENHFLEFLFIFSFVTFERTNYESTFIEKERYWDDIISKNV